MTPPNHEVLYLEYYPKVYGHLCKHIFSKDDAEDLAQTVFLKVYAKLDTFDDSKSAISTWIFNIMRNTLIDYLRKNSLRTDVELSETLPSDEPEFSDTLIHEEELSQLAEALERLNTMERDVIILHYYKEFTLVKISETMGLSYAQTKRIKEKALGKLSAYMNR